MRTPARPARRLTTAAAALALAATALAGCSAGEDSSASDSAGGSVTQSEDRAVGGDDAGAPGTASGGGAPAKVGEAAGAVAPAVFDRKLSRRADISITVEDVDAAASRVRSIAASAKGIVLAEAISSEPDLPDQGGFSTITISVPTDALDATLDELAKLGTVHSRNTSTDDVTAQYIDTESRVETMQASVERVRALMSQATKLADIVALEAELSRRQADLEATQTQLAALEDAVALAPVEVRLSTDADVLEEAEDDTGFLAGLTAGWAAFTASVAVVLTVLGALLPFAVLVALVAVPVVVWLRRRGPRAPVAPAPTVQPPPPAV
ncbi:MAG TPA: DUF4349 domain-containing protein [Ornithinibacter sp.]|nr:DUF4349 domain-containing protein [Ornithinibacter sp.]